MKSEIKKYLSQIGSKGGKSGRGKAKARTPEHYRNMAHMGQRWRRRRERR